MTSGTLESPAYLHNMSDYSSTDDERNYLSLESLPKADLDGGTRDEEPDVRNEPRRKIGLIGKQYKLGGAMENSSEESSEEEDGAGECGNDVGLKSQEKSKEKFRGKPDDTTSGESRQLYGEELKEEFSEESVEEFKYKFAEESRQASKEEFKEESFEELRDEEFREESREISSEDSSDEESSNIRSPDKFKIGSFDEKGSKDDEQLSKEISKDNDVTPAPRKKLIVPHRSLTHDFNDEQFQKDAIPANVTATSVKETGRHLHQSFTSHNDIRATPHTLIHSNSYVKNSEEGSKSFAISPPIFKSAATPGVHVSNEPFTYLSAEAMRRFKRGNDGENTSSNSGSMASESVEPITTPPQRVIVTERQQTTANTSYYHVTDNNENAKNKFSWKDCCCFKCCQ